MKYSLLLLLLIVASCKTYMGPQRDYPAITSPPNGYQIEEDLFVDKSEVSNIAWKEYQYHLKQVFGENSSQYLEAYPDTTVWLGENILFDYLAKQYHRSAKFDMFPVVGITQKQAMQYSKWRSDRVLEFILTSTGRIKPRDCYPVTPANNFTSEKYFAGEYLNYEPDTGIAVVPKFTLPSAETIQLISEKVSAINKQALEDCQSKDCTYCEDINLSITSAVNYINNYELYFSPTKPAEIDCENSSILEVHNMFGNVAEWTSDYGVIYGGGWKDTINTEVAGVIYQTLSRSANIGFRNICTFESPY